MKDDRIDADRITGRNIPSEGRKPGTCFGSGRHGDKTGLPFPPMVSNEQQVKMAERKASREALSRSFIKTDEIVNKDLDTIMELMKTSNPDFYNGYKAARVIRDLGGHTTRNSGQEPAETPQEEPVAEPAAV